VAAGVAQVAIRFLCLGIQGVLIWSRSASSQVLQLLVWIRNDRNSNQRLIQSQQDLDELVSDFNRNPRTLDGVLVKPISRVRSLTQDAYPGVDTAGLQVLWARNFPDQSSINLLWGLMAFCLVAAGACLVAFVRAPKPGPAARPSARR